METSNGHKAIMKAVILAAGVGSRLLPKTEEIPKCLLEIDGKPIIQHQLEALRHNNITKVVVVVGDRGEQVEEFLSKAQFSDLEFEVIRNKDFRDTNSSYSLWLARESLKEGFVYLNSDLVFHPQILEKLLEDASQSSIIVDKENKLDDDMFKIVLEGNLIKLMDKNVRLDEADGKAVGPARFGAVEAQKLLRKLDELVSQGEKNKWVYTVFSEFAQENPFVAVNNDGLYWGEVDALGDLQRIEAMIKEVRPEQER